MNSKDLSGQAHSRDETLRNFLRVDSWPVPRLSKLNSDRLCEIEEAFSDRDDEPIVGDAAIEFAEDAKNHPERYLAIADWILGAIGNPALIRSFSDLGCGPAVLTKQVERILPNAEILGIDISQDMLSIAKLQANDRIAFVQGDARQALDLGQRPFDGAISRRMIHRVDGLETVLEKMVGSVRPGGGIFMNYSFRRPTEDASVTSFIAASNERTDFPALQQAFVKAVLNAPTLHDYREACESVASKLDVTSFELFVFPFDVGIVFRR